MNNKQTLVQNGFKLCVSSFSLGLAISISTVGNANAGEQAKTTAWSITRGGLLYDKWWALIGINPPQETHPLYPAAGKKKESATWRRKECHSFARGITNPDEGRFASLCSNITC